MKNKFLIIIIVAAAIWHFAYESVMDKLMKVEYPIVVQEGSGEQYYTPERYSVIEMEDMKEQGLVTLVHFYKKGCRGCEVLNANITKLIRFRPDVAVLQIPAPGLANYQANYLGNELNVSLLPFVMIFDQDGNLLASDDGENHDAYDLFYEWLQKEVDRKNKQLKEEWKLKNSS